jgi:hypothetical protein
MCLYVLHECLTGTSGAAVDLFALSLVRERARVHPFAVGAAQGSLALSVRAGGVVVGTPFPALAGWLGAPGAAAAGPFLLCLLPVTEDSDEGGAGDCDVGVR